MLNTNRDVKETNKGVCEDCCLRCKYVFNTDHWSVTECDYPHVTPKECSKSCVADK